MSLDKCKSNRNTCGVPLPSTCVSFQGKFDGILKEGDFPCNVNIDDIISKFSETIKILQDEIKDLKLKINN